ncbi:MAG: hypothetical protein J3K34DRAFT_441307 [Monoraphidium minutum]|nr:MAG: hypothetical protein J3K34DRAFT_441307 [Monoraphidium minutum]
MPLYAGSHGVVGYHVRLTRERSPVRSWMRAFCIAAPPTSFLTAPAQQSYQLACGGRERWLLGCVGVRPAWCSSSPARHLAQGGAAWWVGGDCCVLQRQHVHGRVRVDSSGGRCSAPARWQCQRTQQPAPPRPEPLPVRLPLSLQRAPPARVQACAIEQQHAVGGKGRCRAHRSGWVGAGRMCGGSSRGGGQSGCVDVSLPLGLGGGMRRSSGF